MNDFRYLHHDMYRFSGWITIGSAFVRQMFERNTANELARMIKEHFMRIFQFAHSMEMLKWNESTAEWPQALNSICGKLEMFSKYASTWINYISLKFAKLYLQCIQKISMEELSKFYTANLRVFENFSDKTLEIYSISLVISSSSMRNPSANNSIDHQLTSLKSEQGRQRFLTFLLVSSRRSCGQQTTS